MTQSPKRSAWSGRLWLAVGIGVVIVTAGAISAVLLAGGEDDNASLSISRDTTPDETTTSRVADEDDEAGSDGPRVDSALARRLIEVDGLTFEATDPPGTGVFETLKVRAVAPLMAFTIAADGGPVGRLTLVRAPDGIDPLDFEDDSIDRFFDDLVQFVAGEPVTTDDGTTFVATNGYAAEWVGVADEFVMHAYNDVDDQARWQWFWDDLLWIVEGPASTETVVTSMIGAQHEVASPDPYDTHVLAGELNERFLDAPGYWYWDQPRSQVLAVLPGSITQQCEEQYLIFIVSEAGGTRL